MGEYVLPGVRALCEADDAGIESAYADFVAKMWEPACAAHGPFPGVDPGTVATAARKRLFLLLCHGRMGACDGFIVKCILGLFEAQADATLARILCAQRAGLCGA